MDIEPHHGGGGSIAGPCTDPPGPEFSLEFLVHEIRRILADSGIPTDISDSQLYVAKIAAADLLRALGIRPVNAPERRS